MWEDGWNGIKNYTNSITNIIGGYFDKFGSNIKVFANEAMLSISEIPLIGKAIDKAAVEARLKEAEDALMKSNERIKKRNRLIQ